MNYCEVEVAYVTEDDEDPHPCGKPAVIRIEYEGEKVWCCAECYDVLNTERQSRP